MNDCKWVVYLQMLSAALEAVENVQRHLARASRRCLLPIFLVNEEAEARLTAELGDR